MALKDNWIDLEDAIEGVSNSGDGASAEDINKIAHAVIELEENGDGINKETDPTVPFWAKQPNKPTYTADEVGAYTKNEVDNLIGDIDSALDELHNYAQALIGGASE